MTRIPRVASRSQQKTSREVKSRKPFVGILGGSKSDFPILKKSGAILDELGISYELLVVSAHRTPDRLFEYATSAPMPPSAVPNANEHLWLPIELLLNVIVRS